MAAHLIIQIRGIRDDQHSKEYFYFWRMDTIEVLQYARENNHDRTFQR